MADEQKDDKAGVEHVNLKVCGQDGSVVQFKAGRSHRPKNNNLRRKSKNLHNENRKNFR